MVLVNATEDSVLAERALGLFSGFGTDVIISVVYRKKNRLFALLYFLKEVIKFNPILIYLVDTSIPGAFATILSNLFFRKRFVVDTGDFAYQLAKSNGTVGPIGRILIFVAENWSLKLSSLIVVRGTFHRKNLLEKGFPNVEVIRDSTWTDSEDAHSLRRSNDGLRDKELSIGLVGTLTYSPRYNFCYGWDLLECIAMLRDEISCVGIVIGDGTGLEFLRMRAEELGVSHLVRFYGRIPYKTLRSYLYDFDIALSTQSNDSVGWARTTSKLAEYMAAGCFVLASDVGEATLLLPDLMRVNYNGIKDINYPAKLADRVRYLNSNRDEIVKGGERNFRLARETLDYTFATAALKIHLEPILGRTR